MAAARILFQGVWMGRWCGMLPSSELISTLAVVAITHTPISTTVGCCIKEIFVPGEEHQALIRRLFDEGFNRGNPSVVDAVFHSHFIDHSTPDQPPGIQGVKDYIAMVRAGFPDIAVTIEDLVAAEDRVVVRTTWRGTHQGTYEGLPPTGRQVTRTMIQIFRVADGKLVEEWSEGEGLLQQILA